MSVMWNHVTLQASDWQRMMKWQLWGWRWGGERKERDQRWHFCSLTTLWKDYHGGLRTWSSHPASCSGFFPLSFPSSLHLPFPFLLSLVHSQYPCISSCLLRVSSGGPICYLQGVIVGSRTEDDGGNTESVIARDSFTIAQMGSEDCSAFPPLNHQSLFISGPWPQINSTSVTHKSKWLGWREGKRRDWCFSLASARTLLLLEHKQVASNKGDVRWHGQWCVLKPLASFRVSFRDNSGFFFMSSHFFLYLQTPFGHQTTITTICLFVKKWDYTRLIYFAGRLEQKWHRLISRDHCLSPLLSTSQLWFNSHSEV